MKHHNNIRSFGRPTSQRKALLKGLARSLVLKGRIKTTEARAKELRPFVERLVTYGKGGELANRRRVIATVGSAATDRLYNELVPGFMDRNGGYTRITKLSPRQGDASPMAYIEFVESTPVENQA